MRIVGLDLSLTSTGIACVDGGTVRLKRVTSKPSGATLTDRSRRLRGLVATIWPYLRDADLIMVEGPAYGSKTGSMHDRSGLWWLVTGRATGSSLQVVEVPPSCVKTYATGAGNADKDRVLAAVIRRYPHVEVDGNDCADALVLAALGARWLGKPLESDLPQHHLRALDKIAWPHQVKEVQ